jgi:Uma2 family endonuclease
MSAQPQLQHKYTIEEYCELLLNTDERFEYFDGEVVSMAGGRMAHGTIAIDIARLIGNLLEGSPCDVYGSETAIKTVLEPPFRFPDASAVCGKPEVERINGIDTLLNPIFICEVLSRKTENYDHGIKFLAYQAIESFREYLLVSQTRPHVTRYQRQPDGQWLRADIIGLESSVTLNSLGVTLTLSQIYRRVDFNEPEPSAP